MRKLLQWILGDSLSTNAWYLVVEIFWAAIYSTAQSFNGAFAIRLGATNAEVSLLSSFPALMAILVMLPAGRFLRQRSRPTQWMLGSLLLLRAGSLLAMLVPAVHLPGLMPGTLLIALLIGLTVPAHFFNVGFIPFLSQVVPEPERATVFASRNAVFSAVVALFSILFGLWLSRVAFPLNYQSMLLMGFATSLVSLYYLSRVHVDDGPLPTPLAGSPAGRAPSQLWTRFVSAVSTERPFSQIIFNTFLHAVGLWLATPLYLLYYVRTLVASEAWLGSLGAVASLATIAGYIFWRRFIRRWGEPLTLKLTIVALGLYPLLAGLVPSLSVILFAAALNGLLAAGVSLSHFNVFLKAMPEAKRHDYTALYLTFQSVGAFIFPLVGIALAERLGFAPVLAACGLLSIVGSMSFWLWPVEQLLMPPPAAAVESIGAKS